MNWNAEALRTSTSSVVLPPTGEGQNSEAAIETPSAAIEKPSATPATRRTTLVKRIII